MLLNLTRKLEDGEATDTIAITGANQAQMSFTVPEDANPGDTIHMVAKVEDDGVHQLKHYQRVIITVTQRCCLLSCLLPAVHFRPVHVCVDGTVFLSTIDGIILSGRCHGYRFFRLHHPERGDTG